jgi:hypothetical protein
VAFKFGHHAADQVLGVRDGFGDQLNIHGRLTGLARTLAIDAMLSDQDQCIGENVKRYGETSARDTHHELVFFEFFATVFVNAHRAILARRMFELGDAGLVVAEYAEDFVELSIDRTESRVHLCFERVESCIDGSKTLLHRERKFASHLAHLGAQGFF